VNLLEQQAQAGAVANSGLAAPRIALAKARLELADAQSQLADARVSVAEAVGVPTRALDGAELSFDPLKDSASAADLTSDQVRRVALRSRPDVLGALAEYAAAEANLQLEIAKQYPDVHISPGYQYDQGDNKWSIGITFELPVLNQNRGPIAEAEARRAEAAARFSALQAKVLVEIERAVAGLRVNESNLATLRALAEVQAKQRDAAEAQFQAGAADQLDLLNARLEFTTSELVRLEAQVKLQQAVGALEDAVYRPVSGEANRATLFDPNGAWSRATQPKAKAK
jgi:outer membrane protein TolC